MLRFLARRLPGLAFTMWAVASLTFVAVSLAPGDPVEAALADTNASSEVIEARRAALGLDAPPLERYARYLGGLATGDLGVTWYGGEPVALAIGQQLPPTLSLAGGAMLVALALGFGLGVAAAAAPKPAWRLAAEAVSGLALAIPVLVSGPLLILVFAIRLDWLPATGQGDFASLILPAVALGISASGAIARSVTAGLRDSLDQPFALAARAKGLSPRQVVFRHALPVGLMPAFAVAALQFGYLLGGAVVTEVIFARQGIGQLLVDAVLRKDLPLAQGIVLLSALVYGLLSLLADGLHARLDPRVDTLAR